MDQTRILFVITQGEWGGAQRYVYDLATNLGHDFSVSVAVGEPAGPRQLQNALTRAGVTVLPLKHLVRPISPFRDSMAVAELRRLYTQVQPDIIHLNSSKAGILGSVAALCVRQPKIVYTVHGWVFNEPISIWRRRMYRWLEKNTAGFKNLIITLSPADYRDGQALGIAPETIIHIPLGIAPDMYLPRPDARAALERLIQQPITATAPIVGTLANYYPTKGLDVLIEAVATVKDVLPPACFVCIGDGDERPRLQERINRYGLSSRIFLLGFIPDAARILPGLDVFVLPSRKEGTPYALLEAMACRLPIIATSVGGVPDMLRSYPAGRLIAPADPAALGRRLLQQLTEYTKTTAALPTTIPSLSSMLAATVSAYSSLRRS